MIFTPQHFGLQRYLMIRAAENKGQWPGHRPEAQQHRFDRFLSRRPGQRRQRLGAGSGGFDWRRIPIGKRKSKNFNPLLLLSHVGKLNSQRRAKFSNWSVFEALNH
jgi:hypothetical protein